MTTNENNKKKGNAKLIIGLIVFALCFAVGAVPLFEDVVGSIKEKKNTFKRY